MKISDFIAQSLSEIALGVHTAKVNIAEIASIAPGAVNKETVTVREYVEFEVSVTVKNSEEKTKGKDGSGGVSATIAIVEAKIDGKGSSSVKEGSDNETISKLKFRVPIQLNAHYRRHMRENPDVWNEDKLAIEGVRKKLEK